MSEDHRVSLYGRIIYRIVRSLAKKKRARPWEDENATKSSTDSCSIFRRGFIFVSEDGEQREQEYSLIVPYQLLRIASHAASAGRLVKISQFCLLRFEDGLGEVIFSSGGVKKSKEIASVIHQRRENDNFAIEVFVDGLSFAVPAAIDDDKKVKVLTLEELSQNQCQQQIKAMKKNSQSKHPINVTGVIDAVSPILVSDPQEDPFAIMELYQSPLSEDKSARTAIVIIRGERALTMHPAIHPGEAITLLSVVHRKWKVPDEFRKRALNEKESNETSLLLRLSNQVQGRVILVTEATSIKWNSGMRFKPDLSLPTTVESLTSIRGIVNSVHYHSEENRSGKVSRVLHFVTIRPLTVSEETGQEAASICRIFTSKYAMPPDVSLGLQTGSIIRAVNIHFLTPPIGNEKMCNTGEQTEQTSYNYANYVACLRSTISIEQCAGECSSRNRLNIRYAPSMKPFLLIQDHRISEMCADRYHSRSSAQLIAEKKFESMVRNNAHLSKNITNETLSPLLRYHYQILDDYGQPSNSLKSSIISRHQQKFTQTENIKNDKQTTRNPYVEFFDHSQYDDRMIESESCSSSFSCCNQYSTSDAMPIMADIEHLRNSCTQYFIQLIGSLNKHSTETKASELQAGWTNSCKLEGLKLVQVLNDYLMQSDEAPIACCKADPINLYTGGQIMFADRNDINSFSLYQHDSCKIPVVIDGRGCKSENKFAQFQDNHFGWVHIKNCILSSVCLGPCSKKKLLSIHASYQYVFLPSKCPKQVHGHTFLFLIDNFVFVGSVYIIATSMIPTNVDRSLKRHDSASTSNYVRDRTLGIAACLEQTVIARKRDCSNICGQLTRNRFKFRKVKSTKRGGERCYEGMSIILCHIDQSEERSTSSDSALQTIEVIISIPFCDSNTSNDTVSLGALRSGLRELFSGNSTTSSGARLSSDQETMCLAWWYVSENQALPILAGGSNETRQMPCPVHVEIPLRARSFVNLGYQRFRCHISELIAYHAAKKNLQAAPVEKGRTEANIKILPGMISRRFQRINRFPSLLTFLKPGGGIPLSSLADLHWEVCKAIGNDDNSFMKPSLLRRIQHVKILGISFCRAQVECLQCFQPLVNTEMNDGNQTNASMLLCPSECPQCHASVKWECSAIVDDGTGQAKLYAEREAALLLLGTDLDVTAIERGAWCCEEGILFQPSLPPSSNLSQSIRTASIEARRHLSSDKKTCSVEEELSSAYRLLQDKLKAEYLIQHHCRHWLHHHGQRRLDLFCRCKPLSEDLSLNGTEINVVKAMAAQVDLQFGMTNTATLPPLKLILEDACVWSEERNEEKYVGWQLLKAL